ncbi:MAG: YraN family protein [Pseudomonadota bacterium]
MQQQQKDHRVALGRRAERLAEERLRAAGFRIVDRNFHARRAELDLVATIGRQGLVFVEVRSLSGRYLASPALTVTPAKRRRVITAARAWMAFRGMRNWDVRFDVIAVRFGAQGIEVEWIEDAFRPEDVSRRRSYY